MQLDNVLYSANLYGDFLTRPLINFNIDWEVDNFQPQTPCNTFVLKIIEIAVKILLFPFALVGVIIKWVDFKIRVQTSGTNVEADQKAIARSLVQTMDEKRITPEHIYSAFRQGFNFKENCEKFWGQTPSSSESMQKKLGSLFIENVIKSKTNAILSQNDLGVISALIQCGSKPSGDHLMHIVRYGENYRLFKMLVSNGADLNYTNGNENLLSEAIDSGSIAKVILVSNANPLLFSSRMRSNNEQIQEYLNTLRA